MVLELEIFNKLVETNVFLPRLLFLFYCEGCEFKFLVRGNVSRNGREAAVLEKLWKIVSKNELKL